MSNYVKAVDFASKDALTTGNPLKLIKGTEINDEFNAIQTAVATKADLASPAFTGNPTSATQAFGNNTTRLATTAFVQTALAALHPIGSIYIAVISTNPATLFGFGTWVAFGAGKALVGLDGTDTSFDTVEETGGSKNAVVVSHTHTTDTASLTGSFNILSRDIGESIVSTAGIVTETAGTGSNFAFANGSTVKTYEQVNIDASHSHNVNASGVSGTNANLQPYVVVYMWKRTA